MLSLSIFSSSQRISVALYEGKLLKKFFEKIVRDKTNDSIFLLINKILNKRTSISNVFFSVGPGSFTALRSIKAIAQAIAFSHKAKIVNVTEFEIYLSCFKNKDNKILVFYENFNNNFFYQLFMRENKMFIPDSNFFAGNLEKLKKFINEENRKNKALIIVSNSNKFFSTLNSITDNKKKVFRPCAKRIANAVFSGYGRDDKSLIYHHTYYE